MAKERGTLDPSQFDPSQFDRLPPEMLEDVFKRYLFPRELLHLYQLGGRKETRSRAEFEEDLVRHYRTYLARFMNLQRLYGERYRDTLLAPSFRLLLYRQWLAIPPEGLYEKPHPRNALDAAAFRRLNLRNPPGRQDSGHLKPNWYRNFLGTVLYNERNRALSLSTARAVQLFFLVRLKNLRRSEIRADCRAYWGITSNEALKALKSRHADRGRGGLRSSRPKFMPDEFPLTYDIDNFRILGQTPEHLRDHPLLMGYQSFDQEAMATDVMLRGTRYNVTPHDTGVLSILGSAHIELVRLLAFSGAPRIPMVVSENSGEQMSHFLQSRARSVYLSVMAPPSSPIHGSQTVPHIDMPIQLAPEKETPRTRYVLRPSFTPWQSHVWLELHGFRESDLRATEGCRLHRFLRSMALSEKIYTTNSTTQGIVSREVVFHTRIQGIDYNESIARFYETI